MPPDGADCKEQSMENPAQPKGETCAARGEIQTVIVEIQQFQRVSSAKPVCGGHGIP